MISRFLKRKTIVTPPTAPSVPNDVTVWAVGDVHGCLDLLVALVAAIRADARQSSERKTVVVVLGDYIDRGPDSRGVLRYLAALSNEESIEWRFLKGNHEETMLKFLSDPTVGQQWCDYGGDATLASYGLRLPQMRHRVEAWAHVAADLDHHLTPAERQFLERLELSITIGDYFFAHAGARPGEALDRQTGEDLMWIRRTFLDSPVGFERIVVHGHTPEAEVHSDGRRVGVDTRAYASGVLSALRLSGRTRETVQAVLPGKGGEQAEASKATGEMDEVRVRRATLPLTSGFLVRASAATVDA